MAKKRVNKKTIIVNRREYVMPEPGIEEYLHYLEVRDSVMNTENRNGLYTKQQFLDMMDCICELYGNQFTREELANRETGLSVPKIIMEFAAIDIGIGREVNESVEELQKNFQSGN